LFNLKTHLSISMLEDKAKQEYPHLDWPLFQKGKAALWRRAQLKQLRPLKKALKLSIVDSGFDLSHPYLRKRLLFHEGWNAEGGHTLDEAEGLQAFFGSEEEIVSSHGTHIAGIIAQLVSEAVGIVPVRVGSSDSWVLQPLKEDDWMEVNGRYRMRLPFDQAFEELRRGDTRVVNLSWRLNFADPYLLELLIGLADAEKLIVIAAGNDAEAIGDDPHTEGLALLAQHPRIAGRILLVGATAWSQHGETLANFSSYPAPATAPYFIWAPGQAIVSTAPLQNKPRGFELKSGTSMAAGVVTAVLAQLLGENPGLSVDQARALLLKHTSSLAVPKELSHLLGLAGCGLLNMQKVLDAAQKEARGNARGEEDVSNDYHFLPPGGFA
jgi:subtilisin family serine protease